MSQVLQCSAFETCQWGVQENARLATECKRAQDLAASRQAALEEYTSLLSRMNAVTKPK